jgi:outer membrane protein insertion porin family
MATPPGESPPWRDRPSARSLARRGHRRGRATRAPSALVRRAALVFALVAVLARPTGADLPGTPQPSRGSPGNVAGRIGPFGTEGDEALRSSSPAEEEASALHEVLERIDIEGNHHTDRALILAELSVKEGGIVTPEDILASRVRLLQLGTFSRVEMEPIPGSGPGLVVLHVTVDERSPVEVTDLGAGHTAVSPAYGSAGLADPVLFGRVGLSGAVALDGQGRRAFQMSLYAPDLRIARQAYLAGLQAFFQQGLESGCATPDCNGNFSAIPWLRYRRLGLEIDGGLRPGPFSRILVGYHLETLRGASDEGVTPAARPVLDEGRSTLSAVVLGFDFDTRDDALLPSGGTRFEARLTLSSAAILSDYEYSRYLVQAERWFGSGGGRALRLDLVLGLVQGNAPFFERFYAADWSYFSVGVAAPRALDLNFSPDSRYDVLLAVLGLEYDFTLWKARQGFFRRGLLALGARFVYSAATAGAGRSALSATPVSIDAAFRMDTRIGVITIGLGYVADEVLKFVRLNVPGVEHR